jgi:hypothetical protein
MRRWIPAVLIPLGLSLASASHALAPGDAARGFREGANHHLGDDSFAALYGRLPAPGDSEALRMHTHFMHVREWLAARPPTRPELAARRQEILGHFDEYIAKGTTPLNLHVPWRTPVFIDDRGTICAVGYLIERTAGRALAEKVARDHRYNVLEDIAAAMPEVREWVESSGLAMEELASIQPGYIAPNYWNEADIVDGQIDSSPLGLDVAHKSGTWTSRYPTGKRLAQGPYVDKRPEGAWRFFYPSGNPAAEGTFTGGVRDGQWTFFHDSKAGVRMATGSFVGGVLVDEWRHFDERGALIGRSRPASTFFFGGAGYLLDVLPRGEPGRHWVHQAEIAGTRHRLDYLADGHEQIYIEDADGADDVYDSGGHKVSRVADHWESSDCHWSTVRKAVARVGDVVTLHGLIWHKPNTCDDGRPVTAARGRHLDAMLTSLGAAEHGAVSPETDVPELVSSSLASFIAKPGVEASALSASR